MPSILESAFRGTCAVKRRTTGQDDLVTINGKDYGDALVEILDNSEIFVAGGKAESGGFRCQIAISDFDEAPERFDDISVRNSALKILSVSDVNGIVYLITAGDPTSET